MSVIRNSLPPKSHTTEEKRQRLAQRQREGAKPKQKIIPRIPKSFKDEIHELLDQMFAEAIDLPHSINLEPGQAIDRRASDYAMKDFIRCVERWAADKRNEPSVKKAMHNSKEVPFPRKWMERDPAIAAMMRRLKHFNSVCNYLYGLTADRKECEALSAQAGIEGQPHAIFEGGQKLLNGMSKSLSINTQTAYGYRRALTEIGILREFGPYHKRLYSIGLWNRRPDQSWNRILHFRDTPEWRELLAGLTIT